MKNAIKYFGRVAAVSLLLNGALSGQLVAQQQGDAGVITESPVAGITFRFIESNGITMRIAEAGTGPLVLLAHGWPESWYSWRHQISMLAEMGYHVVAPDMRGYGETDKPMDVDDYDINHVAGDLVGILDALDEETAILVGHDWGAIVAWSTVLLHPTRFSALIAMSVPYGGRVAQSPMESWREAFGENFFYILYHNEPGGVAEAEYDADPNGLISRLYLSPNSPREPATITDPHRSAGGWIGRLGAAKELPDWLGQQDMDYVVSQFESAGFRGGMNYYRNFHRNWEITEHLQGATIKIPVLFIAGSRDMVISGADKESLTATISRAAEDLRDVVLIPDIGHWVQQEAPEETNAAIKEFLNAL
ncbi:MAG: alpha/beta hydrolase [Gammaproteobacteria bacterium]|nr:alpha/beta hydrolase [Gammaproteobacteria bacterium]